MHMYFLLTLLILTAPGVCEAHGKVLYILNTRWPFATTPIKRLPEGQIARPCPEGDGGFLKGLFRTHPTQDSLSPWAAWRVSWHEMLRTLWKEFYRQKYCTGITDISIWSAKLVRLATLSTEETPKFYMFYFRNRNFVFFQQTSADSKWKLVRHNKH